MFFFEPIFQLQLFECTLNLCTLTFSYSIISLRAILIFVEEPKQKVKCLHQRPNFHFPSAVIPPENTESFASREINSSQFL